MQKSLRILYVAKHDSGGNDDEGAITHALTELGHDVQRVRESQGKTAYRVKDCDFLLFHKWDDIPSLRRCNIPKVFWYFDLVDHSDLSISSRCRQRKEWMSRTISEIDLGFCTDGDWVSKDKTGKLIHLLQGADERVVGRTSPDNCPNCAHNLYIGDALFTGIVKGGTDRISWVNEMESFLGSRFYRIQSGSYGKSLCKLISQYKLFLCPDFPVTDLYASNRVFVAGGFGAVILHPYSEIIAEAYKNNEEILFYKSRNTLKDLIDCFSQDLYMEDRKRISEAVLQATKEKHLYRHRCQQLISTVMERLL